MNCYSYAKKLVRSNYVEKTLANYLDEHDDKNTTNITSISYFTGGIIVHVNSMDSKQRRQYLYQWYEKICVPLFILADE